MIISTKFNHADLLSFPEDGKRREIIDGDMFVTPAPKLNHQRILVRLTEALLKHLSSHPVGELVVSPMDVIFSDFDVLEPDLILVLNEHKNILEDWVRGAPDLVIEILSPTTAARDRGVKLRAYARFGVQEYWILDPDAQAIEVYRLTPEGYELTKTFRQGETLTSALLPDFGVPVEAVFKQ
jgi:Uma2 family endonuclease